MKRRDKRREFRDQKFGRLQAASRPQSFVIAAAVEDFKLEASAGDDSKKLRKFSMTAYTGVSMRPMGFMTPVVVDLSTAKAPTKAVPVFKDHDTAQIVGHGVVEISAQRIRLVDGVVSGVGDAAQEVIALADNSFPWQASIGADPGKMEFIASGESVNVNGRRFDGPVYVARDTEIGEVSFVAIGADKKTSANLAATAAKGEAEMKFDEWLTANGFEAGALNDKAKAKLKAQYDAEQEHEEDPPPKPVKAKKTEADKTMEEIIAAARAEENRKHQITELIAGAIQDDPDRLDVFEAIGRQAIEGKWDIPRTDLELLRASRSKGPLPVGDSNGRMSREIDAKCIEAAVCMEGGLSNLDKHYDAKTLDSVHRNFRGGLGLEQLICTFARRNGLNVHSYKGNIQQALKYAFREQDERTIRAAGPSTFSLPGILSNVANKFLRDAFMAVESVWRAITAVRSVRDFKQISTYSLTGDLTYKKVAAGGELEHGTLGEETYTNQADTYGRILGIDRRDLINDDLGAFTSAGRRLGRGAALKINDVFWTKFLNNSAFFTTALGNLDEGTDTALSLDALALADTLFRAMTDPDGNPMASMPRILLVPAGLRISALNFMNSTQVVGQGASSGLVMANNPFAGAYRVESSVYMSNSTYTGYSAIAWYLLADPSDVPVIETVFLNGQESPTVETAEMEMNRLGITLRGYHDFGVELQEYRGGVKMKGSS